MSEEPELFFSEGKALLSAGTNAFGMTWSEVESLPIPTRRKRAAIEWTVTISFNNDGMSCS